MKGKGRDLPSRFEDRPRSLRYEEIRKERQRLLEEEPHVAELKRFVEDMRSGTEQGRNIPHFDPLDGGVEARCLFLFEAAGGKAVESGFVSRNNDDKSAENFFNVNREANGGAGLDRGLTISWNIVPWALRETGKNRKPEARELRRGLGWLEKLLGLLSLESVVLCGDSARRATEFFYTKHPVLYVLHAPHPSAQSMNQPGKRDHLRSAVEKAGRLVS